MSTPTAPGDFEELDFVFQNNPRPATNACMQAIWELADRD